MAENKYGIPMNEKQEKWNQFKETGKVEDYLKYKESKDKESL